jgi:hypothetical protein
LRESASPGVATRHAGVRAPRAPPNDTLTVERMKQDATFFEGKEPVLVYIAKKLNEALRLEGIFAESNLEFGVEADQYRGGVIFRSVRAGAFFYVLPEAVDAAHEILRLNGYKPYIGPVPEI